MSITFRQLKLCFYFYKTTLLINWAVSALVCAFYFSLANFAFSSVTAGFFASIYYKELTKKEEYYFYFNAGISRFRLIGITFLFSLCFTLLLFTLSFLCKIP